MEICEIINKFVGVCCDNKADIATFKRFSINSELYEKEWDTMYKLWDTKNEQNSYPYNSIVISLRNDGEPYVPNIVSEIRKVSDL